VLTTHPNLSYCWSERTGSIGEGRGVEGREKRGWEGWGALPSIKLPNTMKEQQRLHPPDPHSLHPPPTAPWEIDRRIKTEV